MRKRFFRAATVSIVAGLLIAFLFAVPLMQQVYTDEIRERLAAVLALAGEMDIPDGDLSDTVARLSGRLAEEDTSVRLTVLDEQGFVLADSAADAADMENHAARPEIREAMASGTGEDVRQSATTGDRQMYMARRVSGKDGGTRIYRASVSLGGTNQVQGTLWLCGGVGIFMGLVIALISAHYAAGRVVEPLQSLTGAARAMAEGATPAKVEGAPDEMGELAGAFNTMADRLAAAHAELEQANDRLAGILQGMDDGVLAVDAGGRILLMTHRARDLLGDCPATARRLDECGVHYLAVGDILKRVMREGGPVRETLSLTPEERTVQVYAARVSEEPAGGALAVLSDVTRLRKLEQMRSDFVANVTHELKTPLTSIRGYIELLKSGERDPETARSFYEIIEIEAERLQKLTDDLLQLSEIENGGAEPDVPLTSLSETVERAAESLRPEADARGIRLHIFVPPELRVRAHPRRLYQLMKNLMENGVKYNREGGILNISAAAERGVLVIRVHDTGIGIPPEHRDRIFERFYRVDKGRSRELGGTGLGLSIVKHIAGLYGGDVSVASEMGVGTTFTVRFPMP